MTKLLFEFLVRIFLKVAFVEGLIETLRNISNNKFTEFLLIIRFFMDMTKFIELFISLKVSRNFLLLW